MADDREPHEPLWAQGPREEPAPEPEAPATPETPSFARRPALAIAALVAIVAGVTVAVLYGVTVGERSSRVTVAELESYWGDVEMTCRTLRIERHDRTLEFFRCHAQDDGRLPPGAYRPPESNWNSDFDRRPAADYAIKISPAGQVLGWALYRP